MFRKFTTTALSVALLVALVSCGDDSDNGTSSGPDETTATTLDPASAKAEYCAIEASVDEMFNEAFSGINGTPSDEVSAAVGAAVIEQYGDKALAAAPPEIADDVAVLVAATAKMAEGNPGAFNTFIEETLVAGNAVDDFCNLP